MIACFYFFPTPLGVECASGDTFVASDAEPLSMESIFVPDPVVTISIKPTDKSKDDAFSKALNRFQVLLQYKFFIQKLCVLVEIIYLL